MARPIGARWPIPYAATSLNHAVCGQSIMNNLIQIICIGCKVHILVGRQGERDIVTRFDIIIAGAGPAGLSFARSLAGTGLKIALVEKLPEKVSPIRQSMGEILRSLIFRHDC